MVFERFFSVPNVSHKAALSITVLPPQLESMNVAGVWETLLEYGDLTSALL